MPYTKSELETVSFYQDFVTELRDNYFDEIKTFLNNKFRKDGILYSFEDIFTGLGLEDTSTEDNSIILFYLKKIIQCILLKKWQMQKMILKFN